MPGLGLAAWAAIASLAATGATVGEQIASSSNQPDTNKLLKQEQQQQANQAALQKREAITATQGQAQSQVGGSLTDQGFQDFTSQLAGFPGYNSPVKTPGSQPGSPIATPGSNQPVDMAAILQALGKDGGNISGGSGPAQPQNPQQWFELSSPVA